MESNNIVEPTPSDFLQSLKCHLSNIYPNNYNSLEDVHIPRYDEISKRFSLTFGHELQFFIRIPGVINLLGDPLKLYGHAPLCMNLDQDIVFAFAMTDKSQIVISNSQNAIFPQLTIPTDVAQKFDDENNYLNLLLAGYKAALYDSFVAIPKGLQIYISSNLPTKNGFSSSSALILGMCFTTLVANGLVKKTYQETIFENLIKYEKMVSTQIAWHHHFTSMLFNKKDNVLLPNDKKSLELPPKYNFIIAHTLTPTVMLFVSGQRQNKRLVECRIGLCMMMKKMEMKDLTKMKSLGEFQDSLGYDHEEMVQLLQDSIEKKKYKTEEIEKEFGMTIINLISDIPYANNVIESNKEYNPYERCLHIFTENMRIENITKCLLQPNMKDDEKAEEIAKFLNESFQSQKENFDCITEECENLKKMMLNYGVLGCRLASNGWGGSLIGIAPMAKSNKIIEFLMNDFYLDPKNKAFVNDDLNMLVFQSNPGTTIKYVDPQFEIWF